MKSTFFLVALCCLSELFAQNIVVAERSISFEAGLFAGPMNVKTDLGRDFNFNETKLNYGFFGAANFKNLVASRLQFTIGSVAAKDADIPVNASLKRLRNLSFRSRIYEASVLFECYPFNDKTYYGSAKAIIPYCVAGIGLFRYDPETYFTDKNVSQWVRLKPLHIDGQGFPEYPDRKPYSLTQVNFPLGFGFKYDHSNRVNVKLEFLYRLLRTDYLDDVSEARTDVKLYSKYLSPENAYLAEKLYIRRGEIDNGTNTQTGPRGGKGKDGYFSLNILLAYQFKK